MKKSLATLAALISLAVQPAWAGGYVTLKCGEFQREFLIGSGRQIRGQGLELWPMQCLDTGSWATYPRIADKARFDRFEAFAQSKVKDSVPVQDVLQLQQDLGEPQPVDMFDRVEDLTFGDIRNTLANIARDSGEVLPGGRHRLYTHTTCKRLVPFDYYLDTGVIVPSCGEALRQDTSNHTQWE